MTTRPLILLTNDDGIDSPGLHAVMEAVADLGELLVVAPISQQTAAGRSYPIALSKAIHQTEIYYNGQQYPAYKVDASPAQAVTLAVRELATRPIDLCISGINYGENLGSGVTISGTVGAALDAACFGSSHVSGRVGEARCEATTGHRGIENAVGRSGSGQAR